MIARLAQWWMARTSRERLIVQGAAFIMFVVILPLLGYQAATQYRQRAAADLASARTVMANVELLKQVSATPTAPSLQGVDGTTRGLALAAAEAAGLSAERIEPAGPDRVRIAFAAAQSIQFYRWIDIVNRRGAFVSRTHMTRTGEGDQVKGEFEVAAGP